MKSWLWTLIMLISSAAQAQQGPSAESFVPQQEPFANESIWPRLVQGMRLGGEERPEVQRFIAHYCANPAFFSTMLSRAEPFLWLILEAAEKHRLPTELALLPAVESSWNPHAVSVSSAYGLWQFIPKTGKAYGLRDALNYDARRDPVASTAAAMRLLDELYGEYQSWPLALAAYNTGGVRLKQVMRTSNSRNFWQLPLPPVTRDYVPRLLAIAALVRNPQRYGVSLPTISAHPVAELVALDHGTSLPSVLAAAGVDPVVLRTFNPGLRRTDAPTQSPTLLLPRSDALALRAELAARQQTASNSQVIDLQVDAVTAIGPDLVREQALPVPESSRRLHWETDIRALTRQGQQQHRVQRGDTLFAIARQHGLDVAQLKRLNPAVGIAPLQVDQLINLVGCTPPACG